MSSLNRPQNLIRQVLAATDLSEGEEREFAVFCDLPKWAQKDLTRASSRGQTAQAFDAGRFLYRMCIAFVCAKFVNSARKLRQPKASLHILLVASLPVVL